MPALHTLPKGATTLCRNSKLGGCGLSRSSPRPERVTVETTGRGFSKPDNKHQKAVMGSFLPKQKYPLEDPSFFWYRCYRIPQGKSGDLGRCIANELVCASAGRRSDDNTTRRIFDASNGIIDRLLSRLDEAEATHVAHVKRRKNFSNHATTW